MLPVVPVASYVHAGFTPPGVTPVQVAGQHRPTFAAVAAPLGTMTLPEVTFVPPEPSSQLAA